MEYCITQSPRIIIVALMLSLVIYDMVSLQSLLQPPPPPLSNSAADGVAILGGNTSTNRTNSQLKMSWDFMFLGCAQFSNFFDKCLVLVSLCWCRTFCQNWNTELLKWDVLQLIWDENVFFIVCCSILFQYVLI